MGWGKITGEGQAPRLQSQVLWGGSDSGKGGVGRGRGTEISLRSQTHTRSCGSSTELWAPLCKAMFARWGVRVGGRRGNRDSVSLCHNFDGGGEETAPTLLSPFPQLLGSPPPLSPHLSHPSLSLCPPTPGGPSPSLLQAPREGEGVWGGGCIALYGFIYNILKK